MFDEDIPMLQVDGTGDGEGEQEGGEETAAAEQQEEGEQQQVEGQAGEEAGIEGLADPEGQVGLPDGGDQLPLIDPAAGE